MIRRLSALLSAIVIILAAITASADSSGPKPVVAVFDITIDGFQMSQDMIKRLTRYLNVRMMMAGKFQTAPETQLKEAMVALKLESQKDCYDETCRIQLGLEAAANKNLNVTIWKVGSRCSIIGALYDLRAAASESATEVKDQECTEEGLKAGIEQFATQLGTTGDAALSTPSAQGEFISPGDARQSPAIPKNTGFLSIQGTPAGARLDITGPRTFGDNGKATTSLPMTATMAPIGKYTIRVSMPGYDDIKKSFSVKLDATETLTIDLIQSSGQLEISGTPEGAKGSLKCSKAFSRDFTLPGQFSPWIITVPRGKCRLLVERKGRDAYKQTFQVTAGATMRIVIDEQIDTTAARTSDMTMIKKAGLATIATGGALMLASLVPLAMAQVQASKIQEAKSNGTVAASWTAMMPYGEQWWSREGSTPIQSLGSMVSRQRELGVAGWSLFGVGSVAALLGAIMLGVDYEKTRKRNLTVSVLPSGSGATAGVAVSF